MNNKSKGCFQKLRNTSNLSKAHVTRDSIGPATWGISVGADNVQ